MRSQSDNIEQILRILRHINSSIRSGQFTYAYRDINNLLSWLGRGEINPGSQEVVEKVTKNLRRTASIIRPMVDALSLIDGAMHTTMLLKNSVDTKNKGESNGTERKQDDGTTTR
jgi:hypothetical protein